MTNQQEGATTGLPNKREEMTGGPTGRQNCAGCGKAISDRYMLRALDLLWHEDCLKCGCCDCRLGEVGSSLYTKANLILCKRDYLRLFGSTGYCSACNKVIPAFEMVMRARNNVYHLECFACQQCNHRFCVGDKFYLCDNKILCEYDYEERLVFASMTFNPTAIAHIKRSTSHLPCPTTTGSGPTSNLPQQQQQQQQQRSAGGAAAQYGQPAAPQPPPPPPPPPGGTALGPQAPSEVTSLSSGYDSPDSPLLDK